MTNDQNDEEQFLEAYILFASGQNEPEIRETLRNRHPDFSPSLKTIEKWCTEFKNISEKELALDAEFEWHRCEEYGIPWKDSSLILEWLEAYIYPPSARTARWIWRLTQTANWENEAEKLLELADMYTNHERELAFNKSTTFSYEQLNLETTTQASYLRALNKLDNV